MTPANVLCLSPLHRMAPSRVRAPASSSILDELTGRPDDKEERVGGLVPIGLDGGALTGTAPGTRSSRVGVVPEAGSAIGAPPCAAGRCVRDRRR